MKKIVIIWLFLFLIHGVAGQALLVNIRDDNSISKLSYFLGYSSQELFFESQTAYNEILDKVRSKQIADTALWLERVFYLVHRKELKSYENLTSLSKTLLENKYDCVTGTALLSLILTDLGISHKILEFPYHVSLLTEINKRFYLLESTDPINGFISDQDEIKNVIEFYLTKDDVKGGIVKPINIIQLAGLQQYNLAVKAFKSDDFESAYDFTLAAEELYPCGRIESLKIKTLGKLTQTVTLVNE